jgi:putative endonuclease
MNHIATGDKGEQFAAEYLRKLGYKIVDTKYRAKTGEIDIIAKDKEFLVFVEVKTRRSSAYGLPAEAVNYRKQQKIINTALCFLKQRGMVDSACRFDILEIYLEREAIQCNHIVNAFGG